MVRTSDFTDILEQTMWHTCWQHTLKLGTSAAGVFKCMWLICPWKVLLCQLSSDSGAQICSFLPPFLAWTRPFCPSPLLINSLWRGFEWAFLFFQTLPSRGHLLCMSKSKWTKTVSWKRKRGHLSKYEPFHTPVRQSMINSADLETCRWRL